jgi:hypothetical protein
VEVQGAQQLRSAALLNRRSNTQTCVATRGRQMRIESAKLMLSSCCGILHRQRCLYLLVGDARGPTKARLRAGQVA